MSLFSEVREDIRLARLNSPFYAFVFRIIDYISVAFKLLLLAAFGLGIWHLVYGLDQHTPDSYANESIANADTQIEPEQRRASELRISEKRTGEKLLSESVSSENINNSVVPAGIEQDTAALTPARVEMLKRFAQANQTPVHSDGSAAVDSLPVIVAIDLGNGVGDLAVIAPVNKVEFSTDTTVLETAAASSQTGEASGLPDITDGLQPALSESSEPDRTAEIPPIVLSSDVVLVKPAVEISAISLVTGSTVQSSEVIEANESGGSYEGPWLLAQSPDHYTIQISSTTNRPFLVTFGRQLPDDQPNVIFHYMFREQPEYGLSYGVFASNEEASAALARLSQKVRRYGAFVRKLNVVHQQINRLNTTISAAK